MNSKLHAICASHRRPIDLLVTAGQVSDYIGARALLSGLPNVKWLLGDRGYDTDWFREALQDKEIRACIPGRKKRKTPVKYDKRRYKRRNRIEIMFGKDEARALRSNVRREAATAFVFALVILGSLSRDLLLGVQGRILLSFKASRNQSASQPRSAIIQSAAGKQLKNAPAPV